MGYRTGWRGWLAGSRPHDLRLITFNVDGGANPRLLEIPGALRSLGADVLAFQECPEELADPARWPAGWSVRHTEGSLCLATRFPIQDVRVIPYVEVGDQGGTGNAAFFRLTAGTRTIDLVVVHLETVRKGLSELRYASDPGRMEDNLLVRGVGARRVRRWLDQQSREPIVAGDFNMPVESRIYRDVYGDCANAFSTTGHGFGYTRVLKRFSARIDHVVACGGWTPLSARVGPDVGSDHLPLIVDLAYSRQAGRKP
jgi:endonuclease/exonuclease/phosphatase (EEP) superfamily protein YafD